MNTINYFIEANLGIVVLYTMYRLVLDKETDFKVQRVSLLIALLAAVLVPFVKITAAPLDAVTSTVVTTLPELVLTATRTAAPESSGWTTVSLLLLVYLFGIALIILPLAWQGYRLLTVYRRSPKRKDGVYTIIESPAEPSSYSFFNIVVIGQTDKLTDDEHNMIILHEKCHGRLLHSLDVLVITLAAIVFWFNPVIWFYRRTILRLHEYQADRVVSGESSSTQYTVLLAKSALIRNGFLLAHPFNQSFILKRINMINKIKTRVSSWKLTLLVTTVLLFGVVAACTDQISQDTTSKDPIDMPEAVSTRLAELRSNYPGVAFEARNIDNDASLWSEPKESVEFFMRPGDSYKDISWAIVRKRDPNSQVYTQVDESASPVFGMTEFYKQLAQVLRYPVEAQRQGIQGKVFVEFVVKEDGRLSDYRILKGIHPECDAAAMTAIMQLEGAVVPSWHPAKQKGKVVAQRIVLPITFGVSNPSPQQNAVSEAEVSATPISGMEKYYQQISQAIRYPVEARRNGVEGKVFVQFVVQEDGTLDDIKVLKGISPECDAEAMKVIRDGGNWNPGKKDGKIVRQQMVFPVSFKLG